MIANTTISAIQNEIMGLDDKIFNYVQTDYIRRISVSNVTVTHVTHSYEYAEPLFHNALIVVSKNETSGAGNSQYSVTRYWQSTYKNWIESEYLFDLPIGPYNDVFIFDKYAIVMLNNNLIDIVYYDQFKGREVPERLEVELYNDLQSRNE